MALSKNKVPVLDLNLWGASIAVSGQQTQSIASKEGLNGVLAFTANG